MFPLRFFVVKFHFSSDFPANATSFLSVILTSAIFPTLPCQVYFNHIDKKTQIHPTLLQLDEI